MIELDWQFEEFTSAEELPGPEAPGEPSREEIRAASRRSRWLGLVALALVTLAALGPSLFNWFTLQRLRLQIQDLVEYEDGRSLAGDAEVVKSLQAADSPKWILVRAEEAALGLAGPLPAANLLPLAEPGKVARVRWESGGVQGGPGVIEATVLRAFADSAGQRYLFDFTQRYRNTSPRKWERLAPDEGRLEETATWAGQRLTASFPALDKPWMEAALPRMDAWLEAACADWECPQGLTITVTFSGQVGDLPQARVGLKGQRSNGLAGHREGGSYPIIFDISAVSFPYPRQRIASPQLSGYPHDEAASEALARAMAARLLGYLGGKLASTISSSGDYFLDALIAREEIRLGISAAPEYAVTAREYLPAQNLWWFQTSTGLQPSALDLPFRLQALSFLDFAISRQTAHLPRTQVPGDGSLQAAVGSSTARPTPGGEEGGLLRNLRRQTDLAEWLTASLGVDGQALIEEWNRRTVVSFSGGRSPPWDDLNGLAYACGESAWIVREGHLMALRVDSSWVLTVSNSLSPDRNWLALIGAGDSGLPQLEVLNLGESSSRIISGRFAVVLGWSGTRQLAYLEQDAEASLDGMGARLKLYDPATGADRSAIPQWVLPTWGFSGASPAWSPDRMTLGVTLVHLRGGLLYPQPALISLADGSVRVLADRGHSPAISPDGRKVAYVAGADPWPRQADQIGTGSQEVLQLQILDLESGVATGPHPLAPSSSESSLWDETGARLPERGREMVFGIWGWAPDGSLLAMWVFEEEVGMRLFTVGADGSGLRQLAATSQNLWPVGFSADGRYFAYTSSGEGENISWVRLIDLETVGAAGCPSYSAVCAEEKSYIANSAVWSPEGRLLALSGPGGVYVVEAEKGEAHWLGFEADCGLGWSE